MVFLWSLTVHPDGDKAVTARWRRDLPVKQRNSCNYWFELLPGKPIYCAARVAYE
jgi:hypothetical protein